MSDGATFGKIKIVDNTPEGMYTKAGVNGPPYPMCRPLSPYPTLPHGTAQKAPNPITWQGPGADSVKIQYGPTPLQSNDDGAWKTVQFAPGTVQSVQIELYPGGQASATGYTGPDLDGDPVQLPVD